MAIYSGFTCKKMVIFHSYVSLPEGNIEPVMTPLCDPPWSVHVNQWSAHHVAQLITN